MEVFSGITELADARIKASVEDSLLTPVFKKLLIDFFAAGGKRIRPILAGLVYEAVGGIPYSEGILRFACSVELVHEASIIFDDVIDGHKFRRNKPTVSALYGDHDAFVAGTFLASYATKEISADVSITSMFSEAVYNLVLGEILDMSHPIESVEDYIAMVTRKCASLFRLAAQAGAVIGGGEIEEIKSLSRFGENLGIAFQLRDDILNFVGEEEVVGKPIGSDLEELRPSIVTVQLARKLEVNYKQIRTALPKAEIKDLLKLAISNGCVEESEKLCKLYCEKAKSALKEIQDSEAKSKLLDLTDFMSVSRRY